MKSIGHTCVDHGCDSNSSVDYPDYAKSVAESVAALILDGRPCLGLLVCGSGAGVAIAANKVSGVRCIQAWCEHIAEYGRRHNHANVLTFGGDVQTYTQARRCVDAFLSAEPEGGRHAARVEMISQMEPR